MNAAAIRAAIAAGLHPVVTAAAVYPYPFSTLGTESPLVMLERTGTMYQKLTARGYQLKHAITIHVFVSYDAADYTEEQSENALDLAESQIVAWINDNPTGALWRSLMLTGASSADLITVQGGARRHVAIPIEVLEV